MTNPGTPTMAEPQDERDAAPLYVYGIVAAEADLPQDLVGVDGGGVGKVTGGSLAAVVTSLAPDYDIGTPGNLLTHSTVLDTLAGSTTVLPMAFGTVVPDPDELHDVVLAPDQESHLAALTRLAGSVQFTVRARYLRDAVLQDLVAENPGIARLREVIAGTTEDETRQARIQLGELIVKAFDRIRPSHAQQIIDTLRPVSQDMEVHERGQVEDVVELAVLVACDRVSEFESALEEIAAQLHARIEFRQLGPQAPYDFVNRE